MRRLGDDNTMAQRNRRRISRREVVKSLGTTAALGWTVSEAAEAEQIAPATTPPNILLILADDMGFSDLGCYGGEIRTPNLDRLAKEGVRFTQFYNTARCCPSRASLLTGLYPHQAGIGHMVENLGLDGYAGDLNPHCVTIAQVLQTAGYGTYMAGKWHVTKSVTATGPKNGWPLQRGFDRYYGLVHGAASYWDPGVLARDNTLISAFADPEYTPERYYFTDAITDHAIRFLEEHAKRTPDRPFFTYVAYTAAHWPLHAPEEEIAKYHGHYDGGYEPLRKARFERMKKMGLLHPDWELSPQAGDWNAIDEKTWEARCMEVYAAQVTRMDTGMGRIIETLRKSGQLDNTLVLFLQDNGGCAEDINREGQTGRLDHPTLPTIGKEVVRMEERPKQTREGYPVLGGKAVLPGPVDTYISYGQSWANVSNTPFREYKHWVHEGGIATPLIAHWPKGIPRRNALEHQPGHLIDIMATCVAVSGAHYPTDWKGQPITPMEGRSLTPALAGKPIPNRVALFWEHEGNRALRIGPWKLVAKSPRGKWELYDTDRDRTELHDLAEVQPDRTREMAAKWEEWAKRTHALPWPWKPPYGQAVPTGPQTFTLKQGDTLRGANAPQIEDREITIKAVIEGAGDGVLVAQGGMTVGYTLFLKGGKPNFGIRKAGKLYLTSAAEALPSGSTTLTVTFAHEGNVTLSVNGKQVANGKTTGLFETQPIDAFCVGFDDHDPVGPYATPFRYSGKITALTITLK